MPRDICKALGRRIKLLRNRRKLTQDELAGRAGISIKYLQNLEGKTPKKATIVTLQKLAKGFDISLGKLIEFKD